GLETSNADLMLDSTFESFEALKGYAVHPDHVAVADGAVRPYTKLRSCLDFEV
ncbi:MAG: Dabb family protein, partial [Lachnospiraceae bacterium]|nr:Dabb family protein [Lachnospiraceae bacterium]